MTLAEFYNTIGESYGPVLSRLTKEDRISKYLLLFLQDPSFGELQKAFDDKNIQSAFRAAHTLKGIAANLGFNKLSKSSSDLTEDLRPLAFTDKSETLLEQVKIDYDLVVSNIQKMQ